MKFRIVGDKYSGYEVQVYKVVNFYLFKVGKWQQISNYRNGKLGTNTSSSMEEAEALIKKWITPQPQPKVFKEIEL